MGLALPNSGCVGGFSCGSSLLFCGVVEVFEAILALMFASGCLCDDDEGAPAEVLLALRSETMAENISAMPLRRSSLVCHAWPRK